MKNSIFKKTVFKKILSATMAVAIGVSGFAISASASNKPIDGFSGTHTLAEMWALGASGNPSLDSNYNVEVHPGDIISIPLVANMFDWNDDRTMTPNQALRNFDLRRGVTVRTRVQSGSQVLDYVQLDTDLFPGRPFFHPTNTSKTGRTTAINIAFVNQLTTIEPVEFAMDIYLTAGGKQDKDYKITIMGTMTNDTVEINNETDYVNISDGSIAVSSDYKVYDSLVDFNLGNGVSISKLTRRNEKYYGVSSFKHSTFLTLEDYPVIYSAIHGIYVLETINIDKGAERVRLKPPVDADDETKVFYVYNEDMEYLGMTNEVLEFSNTYILTTRELTSFETGDYINNLSKAPTQEKANDSNIEYVNNLIDTKNTTTDEEDKNVVIFYAEDSE